MRISDWSSDVCSSDLLFKRKASGAMMDMIRTDLALLGISHDLYSSEAELQASGAIEAAVAQLRADGLVYEGVLEAPKGELPDDWEPVELTLFRSTRFGDDVDRPIRKSDGSWRSEARRVGKECVSTCRSRGAPCH